MNGVAPVGKNRRESDNKVLQIKIFVIFLYNFFEWGGALILLRVVPSIANVFIDVYSIDENH